MLRGAKSLFSEQRKTLRSFKKRLLFEPEKHHFQLCDDAEVTMSPLTRYLSRLLGVFLLVTAVSEWTQPGLLTVVAPAMVDQPALLWVSGMLTFASGLAIVLGHNVWGDPAAAVVSLLGWMMTATACSGRWLDGAARRHALPVTFRRLHDHSGAGGSISHLFRVCPAAATESWTGERTKAVTIRI